MDVPILCRTTPDGANGLALRPNDVARCSWGHGASRSAPPSLVSRETCDSELAWGERSDEQAGAERHTAGA